MYPNARDGGAISRASIGVDMQDATAPDHEPPGDEPPHTPEPDDRPTPRAQWDENAGCWIEWDETAQRWVPVAGDG